VTLFSLRVVEFPSDLHMTFVLKYMFGISVAIIIPLLSIVVYTTRNAIGQLVSKLDERYLQKRWRRARNFSRRKNRWRVWWNRDWKGEAGGSQRSEGSLVKGIGRAEQGKWWRVWSRGKGIGLDTGGGRRNLDTEKGEAIQVDVEANGRH
jgi:hypothetical protein